MKRSRSSRIARIERHVGASGLEDTDEPRDHVDASAPSQMPTRTSGPTPSARRCCAQQVGARVELAVGESPRRRIRRPTRRDGGPPAPRTAGGCSDRAGNSSVVAFQSASNCVPLARGKQRQLADRARPDRPRCPRAAAGSGPPSARSSPRRTDRSRTSRLPVSLPPSSVRNMARSNFAVPRRIALDPLHVEAGHRPPPGRRVVQRERRLEQRIARQVALRRQLLHQLLEGQVLMGVGVERPVAHAAPGIAGTWDCPTGRRAARACSRRKPIIGSSSGRVRPAVGTPTATSSCPL